MGPLLGSNAFNSELSEMLKVFKNSTASIPLAIFIFSKNTAL